MASDSSAGPRVRLRPWAKQLMSGRQRSGLHPANRSQASQPPGASPLGDGLSRRVCKHPGERMLPLWPSAFGLTDRGNYFMLTRVACGIAAAVSGVKAAASGVP